MATEFVQQLREAICLCGWYAQALQRARTAVGQKFHNKPPKYRVGWSAYRSWEFWAVLVLKDKPTRKEIPADEPNGISSNHLFEKDEQLLTREQVTLYWPCGLIIDSGHLTCK